MNQLIISAFSQIAKNKHTSGAALVYAVSKWGCPLISTWWPSHKAQLETTAGILEGMAVFYGFAAAGDSAKSATKDEVKAVASAIPSGDTSQLPRSVNPNVPQEKKP